MFKKSLLIIAVFAALLFAASCSDDPTSPDNSRMFTISISNISTSFGIMSSGVFNTPVGASAPGPLTPGGAYEFNFSAAPGSKLSLATMFVQSNDLFYAPGEAGIDLFDAGGNPLTGDVTSQLSLWDSGTEANEFPGAGVNQAPRQSGANTGAGDPDNTVRLVSDGFTYPNTSDAIKLTLSNSGGTNFTARVENAGAAREFPASGVFNTPVGASAPSAIGPGGAYEMSFHAAPGAKLSFVTMFVPSNDFFVGPGEAGIDLFDGSGNQITGDVTSQLMIWDTGTEVNQEPGLGPDQVQRQSGANTGAADPNNTVRLAPDDFGNLPAVADFIKATLTSTSASGFTLRIENVSTGTTLSTSDGNTQAVPMSPGVWVIHTADAPLFTAGQADRGEGLENIAEDGSPGGLGGILAGRSGLTVILSPGAWAVHMENAPFFTTGQADRGEGLEGIAEDGNPAALATSLSGQSGLNTPFSPGVWVVDDNSASIFSAGQPDRGEGLENIAEDGDPSTLGASLAAKSDIDAAGVFNTPEGASAPGAIGPTGEYRFTVTAEPGQSLSFALMFIQSNDLFLGPGEAGIALFDASGNATSGDVTAQVMLWDAGTEVNEAPGIGLNQAPRQTGANTGAAENGNVQLVSDGFSYPAVNSVLRVTITPQ